GLRRVALHQWLGVPHRQRLPDVGGLTNQNARLLATRASLRRLNMTYRLAVLSQGGIGTARKRILSLRLRMCVVVLLFVPVAAGCCQPADEPVLPRRDRADLDRLLRLMQQRLTLMHEVARWKWNAGRPVTDAERERQLLHSVVERGRGKGLDPDLVRPF